jgi:hypothetical protein
VLDRARSVCLDLAAVDGELQDAGEANSAKVTLNMQTGREETTR